MGYKGRVCYRPSAPLNTWIDEVDSSLPRNEYFTAVARRLDSAIHSSYELFPTNYVAADLLNPQANYQSHYTSQEKKRFEQYLEGQIAKITIPNKDESFLRERILTMYANPLINYNAAK